MHRYPTIILPEEWGLRMTSHGTETVRIFTVECRYNYFFLWRVIEFFTTLLEKCSSLDLGYVRRPGCHLEPKLILIDCRQLRSGRRTVIVWNPNYNIRSFSPVSTGRLRCLSISDIHIYVYYFILLTYFIALICQRASRTRFYTSIFYVRREKL